MSNTPTSPQYLEASFVKPADSLPLEYWTSLADAMKTISKTDGISADFRKRNLETLVRCFEHPFNPIAVMPAMVAPEMTVPNHLAS